MNDKNILIETIQAENMENRLLNTATRRGVHVGIVLDEILDEYGPEPSEFELDAFFS